MRLFAQDSLTEAECSTYAIMLMMRAYYMKNYISHEKILPRQSEGINRIEALNKLSCNQSSQVTPAFLGVAAGALLPLLLNTM